MDQPRSGIERIKLGKISVPRKLVKYVYAVTEGNEKTRKSYLNWVEMIFKRFPQEEDSDETRLKKNQYVQLVMETLANKLANGFKKDDVIKAYESGDLTMVEKGIEKAYDMRVRYHRIPTPYKYGYFVEILKPLLRPHVSFMSLMNRIEVKRPEVFTWIMAEKERLWWFVECVRQAEAYIGFWPEEYMFTKAELAGVTGMGRATDEEMRNANQVISDDLGFEL